MLKLYNGDCLKVMKKIPSRSVDLVLCDLPYGTTQHKWDTVISFEKLWKQYKRICTGAIVLTAAQPFTSALIMSNPKMFKYAWVWDKGKGTGHLNAKKQPLRSHEDVLVFYKSQCVYRPQMRDVGFGYKSSPTSQANMGKGYGKRAPVRSDCETGARYPLTVLQFTPVDNRHGKIHPSQKPVKLMEYLIRTYSNRHDVVLDNCMGSGTTGVACINTRRSFIGIEKDVEHFKQAKDRIKSARRASRMRKYAQSAKEL